MDDTHVNPLYFHDATPPHLLQFEETQRAKKAGPSPHLVIHIPFMHGTLKKKTARAS